MRAGAAEVDITPPLGVPLAGSFSARYAVDVDDPLACRAVVLEGDSDPAGPVALVLCDLICMPGDTVRAVRRLLSESGDVSPERVLVAATHTHTAPSPTGLLGTPRADAYMDALPARIASAVSLAARRLRPARISWGAGHEAGVSFNRRFRMRDGTVRMNPGRGNPDALSPTGPIDPELGVLWAEGTDGAPIACLASFALHYVGTDASGHVSADYFGAYARWVRRLFGPQIVPLLFNGASGDVNNVDVQRRSQPSGRRQAERVAAILAGETLRVVQRALPVEDASVGVAGARLPFTRKTVTAADLDVAGRLLALPPDTPPRERRARAGLAPDGPFSWVVGQPLPDDVMLQYAAECRHLAALPEGQETEVLALRVGACGVVALPGEIFVQLGLSIKERSPFRPTLIASLANDYVGYVGTRTAIAEEGGYETWAARSALPAAGAGEAIVDLAAELLASLS